MFSRFFLVLCTLLFLTACGDSAVTTVKQEFVDAARTTNFSQLLDNRASCSKISWDAEKDQMNREVVEYSCLFKNSEDFLAQARKDFAKKVTEKYDFDIKNLVTSIDALKKSHESGVAWTKDFYKEHGKTEDDEIVVNEISEKTMKFEKQLSGHEETLAQWREESNPEKINSIAEKSYPKYDSAIEVFRWVVNAKNEVTIVDGGMYAQLGSNRMQILKYSNANQTFQVIASSREDGVNDYIQKLQKFAFFKFITE